MRQVEKQQTVELLTETVGQASHAFLVDFKGLDVARSTELRVKLRESDGRLRIVKNRLAKRAFAESNLSALDTEFTGQTAIAYPVGDDVVGVAKVLRDFRQGKRHCAGQGRVVVEGKVISASMSSRVWPICLRVRI